MTINNNKTNQKRNRIKDNADKSSATVIFVRNDFLIRGRILDNFTIRSWIHPTNHENNILFNTLELNHNFCFKQVKLSEGGKRIYETPNAGGSSVLSEVLSYEMLQTIMPVRLFCTETEIQYWPYGSKITDFSVFYKENDKEFPVGVSVSRAMNFGKSEFTEVEAERLLRKKLLGIVLSTRNCITYPRWDRQILHIWALDENIAKVTIETFKNLSESSKSNTLLIVTLVKNGRWLFEN